MSFSRRLEEKYVVCFGFLLSWPNCRSSLCLELTDGDLKNQSDIFKADIFPVFVSWNPPTRIWNKYVCMLREFDMCLCIISVYVISYLADWIYYACLNDHLHLPFYIVLVSDLRGTFAMGVYCVIVCPSLMEHCGVNCHCDSRQTNNIIAEKGTSHILSIEDLMKWEKILKFYFSDLFPMFSNFVWFVFNFSFDWNLVTA